MDPMTQKLEQRISQLEAQVATLQQSLLAYSIHGTTLQAPVRIVDAEHRLLAELRQTQGDLSLRLYNEHGIVAASVGVDGTDSGYVAIRNAGGVLVGYLDVGQGGARLVVQDHAEDGGVVLFGGDGGEGGGVNLLHTGNTVSLGLWTTPAGGELTIYDREEHETVRLPDRARGVRGRRT